MGWASATQMFDDAVDVALRFIPKNGPGTTENVVRNMYTKVSWNDWDTQDESKYFEPYLKQVMIELGEIDLEELGG